MKFDNETEIQCYLYSNLSGMQKLLRNIIKDLYKIEVNEEEIKYVGVEYSIPNKFASSWDRGRKRIDILYSVRDIFIPIEIKQYASPDSIEQVEKYAKQLEIYFNKKSLCGVIGNRISKYTKNEINNKSNTFWFELESMTWGV